jgi:transcription-repair coupling factor (superfamily II helicase)
MAATVESGRGVLDPTTLSETRELARIETALAGDGRVTVGGLWGSSQALVLATLAARADHTWLAIASTDPEAEAFQADLEAFGTDAAVFPARAAGARRGAVDLDSVRERLQVAQRLTGPPNERPRVVVASLLSLLQPVPDPEELARSLLVLQVGEALDARHLLRRLVDAGYERQPLVEKPGEVSVRGDIFDVFPFAADLPLRIELFDDEIESLRSFDPLEQTSVESLQQTALTLAADAGTVEEGSGVQPAKLLSNRAVFVEVEPLRIEDRAGGLSIQSGSHKHALSELNGAMEARRRMALQSLPAGELDIDTRSVQGLSGGIRQAPQLLRELTDGGARVLILCQTEAEATRFGSVLADAGGVEGVEVHVDSIAKGFRLPLASLVVVNHRELAGVMGVRRISPKKQVHKTRALQSFFELKPGDFVVHAVHGLALFKGLERMRRGDGEEEHLHLLFAEDVSLFVPATRIDLVQRYIGAGGAMPPRDKIGGQSFRRRREKVERALFDLAAELLEVQAKRELNERPSWEPDPELTRDLIASFPYADTEDQAEADKDITANLVSVHPMDRLLCGDVGFGKTEIALRAAFRVASAGGQVAMLVPTTVLAHQHFLVFSARLADFPIEVEGLSRTITGKREKEIVQRVKDGAVDILIGTHRILSKDVEFKRLGLVIIDEEQRFGVAHKEHFKNLRSDIDVLALSATPIPRTLHMSLSGVRDISALSVPPPGRQEIETRLVDAEDDGLIRDAILREKNRGGQVFFLHNRVQSIEKLARRLAEIVPDVSFAIGHGQMGARQLQKVMGVFSRGEVDVLVATTIVENGLDIPAAGTIFINDAEMFGLSELHQLRGRVGRGDHKAFCYLLVEKYKPIRQVARERLKALEEMNHLGAGFAISMKDLEIRGAGNILGPQQSGHIAAVGYDMYCRLLKHTIERMRAGLSVEGGASGESLASGIDLELGLEAFLPEEWIPSQDTRLEILRQLDTIDSDEAAVVAETTLRDRFGRLPAEAAALVRSFRLRARAVPMGIERITLRGDSYLLEYTDRVALAQAFAGDGVEFRPIRTGVARLMIPERCRAPAKALDWLEELLKERA